jgi:hypothetical protein
MWTVLLATPALAVDPSVGVERVSSVIAAAPPEVAALLQRTRGCAHWGGEEPYNKERAAQIEKALIELKCDRLEADEVALRRKYAKSLPAQQALDVIDSEVAP